MRSSRGRLSQTLTVQPFSTGVYPDGKSPALTFTRPPATWFVGGHPLLVQAQLSAMRSLVGPGFRGCAPMMGAAVVVRIAECGPGAELVGAHQSWVHLGLSAMRSRARPQVFVGALLVE